MSPSVRFLYALMFVIALLINSSLAIAEDNTPAPIDAFDAPLETDDMQQVIKESNEIKSEMESAINPNEDADKAEEAEKSDKATVDKASDTGTADPSQEAPPAVEPTAAETKKEPDVQAEAPITDQEETTNTDADSSGSEPSDSEPSDSPDAPVAEEDAPNLMLEEDNRTIVIESDPHFMDDEQTGTFTPKVALRGLNKITARSERLTAEMGKSVSFGTLRIRTEKCWKSPPEEAPENKALIRIWEQKPNEETRELFFGWMFSSSPAITSLDHPVYDITVVECKD